MKASRYCRDLLAVSVPPVKRSMAHARVWPESGIRNNRNRNRKKKRNMTKNMNRNRNLFLSEGGVSGCLCLNEEGINDIPWLIML